MATKPIKFKAWLFKLGTPQAMILLNVSEATVRNWRIGRYIPRPEQMLKIREVSKGAVHLDEIISSHLAFKAGAK